MKKILMSLITIAAMSTLAIGATSAVFSDTATVDSNTFATGKLDLRVNGQNSIDGFKFENAAPGYENGKSGQFTLNNYGKPFFDGDSTLKIKELVISSRLSVSETSMNLTDTEASKMLYKKLMVKIEANRGWASWMDVYKGPLKDLKESDLFGSRWQDLPVGWSEDVRYRVWLPEDVGNEWQDKSAVFDFIIDAYNPHR